MKRRLLVVWLLLLASLAGIAMCGAAGYRRGYTGGYGAQASYARGGRPARVDTVRIVTQTTSLRNTSARFAGYITARDTVGAINNSANDGTTVRWGNVKRSNSSTAPGDSNQVQYNTSQCYFYGRGGAAEDDQLALDSPGTLAFVWVSAAGLTNGQKIEKAQLIVNLGAFGPLTLTTGQYLAARLDTVSADYRILNNHLNGRFLASWTKIDSIGGLAWSPPLSHPYASKRDDRHDFGPRSDNVVGPGAYSAGAPMRFLVTDAVQQASDNGTLGRGLLFLIYGSPTVSTFGLCGGTHATYCGPGGNNGKGLPIFTAIASSKRGQKPWNGTRVPVALTYDDQYPVQVGYYRAMTDSGYKFDTAAFYAAVHAYTWVDSIYSLHPEKFGIIHHSRTHPALAGLSIAQMQPQMNRNWLMTELGMSASDTLGIVDYAWPSNGTPPERGFVAAGEMVNNGFRSARGYGTTWTATDVAMEHDTWMSWDGYFNRYQIHANGASQIFNAANMADELGDMADQAYTDEGKSALIFYGHRNTGSPADGITEAKIRTLIGIANQTNYARIRSYSDLITQRVEGQTFITPAQVRDAAGVTADSNAIQNVADAQDSVWVETANINMMKMWVNPHRTSKTPQVSDIINPDPPRSLYAYGQNGSVVLIWSASIASEPVTYRIHRYFDGSADTTTVASGIGPTFYSDATAVNGSPHNYFVTAVDAAGNESQDSNHASATPGTILAMDRPRYFGFWYQDPGVTTFAQATIDSLAQFDAIVMNSFPLEGATNEPAYNAGDGLLRRVRAASGDSTILLTYFDSQTIPSTGGSYPAGSAIKRITNYCASLSDAGGDSAGFGRRVDGTVATGTTYDVKFYNVTWPDLADTIAYHLVEVYDGLKVDGQFAGFFLDDADTTLSDYAIAAGAQSIIDFDGDTDEYGIDATEKVAFKAFQIDLLRGIRREFAERGMTNRLLVFNGTWGRKATPNLKDEEYLSLVDGMLNESWNRYGWPGEATIAANDTTNTTEWTTALNWRNLLTTEQTAPPLVFWNAHVDSNAQYMNEVIALANGGWINAQTDGDKLGTTHVPTIQRRLPNPGTFTGYAFGAATASADTLTATWSGYTARMILSQAYDDTFAVWPYVIFNPTTHDTLSISKYWEKAPDVGTPPALQIAVSGGDNYNDVFWGGLVYAGDIDHFNIRRSTDSSSPTDLFKVQLANVNKDLSGNWSWRDSTAVNDSTEYCYSVASVDVAGNEGPHVDYECATPSDVWPPSALTSFTAVGGPGCNVLNWNTASTADFAGYQIYRRQDGIAFSLIATRTDPMNSFLNDSTAVQAAIYRYTVAQVDDDANQSALSDTLESSWSGPPQVGVPTNLTVNANTPAQEQARLAWTAPSSLTNFVRYRIYKTPDLTRVFFYTDLIDSTTSPTWDDTDSAYEQGYTYCVKALYSVGGLSARSNFAFNMNHDTYPPTSPTLQIAAGNGTDGIDLNWSDVTGAAMYYVWRGIGSASTKIDSTATSAYTDTGAAENMTYTYGIKARDGAWNMSVLSNTMTASWTATPATGPTVNTVSGGTLQNAESVTIAGANFGAKSPAAPMLWETFDAGTDGTYLSTDPKWHPYWTPGAKYSSTAPYRGIGLCANNTIVDGGVDEEFFTNSFWFPTPADTVYYSYVSKFVAEGDSYGIYKSGRSNTGTTGSGVYYGPGNIYISNSGMYGWQDENSTYHDGSLQYFSQSTKNATWTRHQIYKYNGPSATAWWSVGSEKHLLSGLPIRPVGQTYTQRSIILGLMEANIRNGATHRLYVDDVYVDRTQARVEIGDASTFDACSHREIQIPSAWSTTSITATINTGTFANGGAYLFVIDAEGNVSAGKAITISN